MEVMSSHTSAPFPVHASSTHHQASTVGSQRDWRSAASRRRAPEGLDPPAPWPRSLARSLDHFSRYARCAGLVRAAIACSASSAVPRSIATLGIIRPRACLGRRRLRGQVDGDGERGLAAMAAEASRAVCVREVSAWWPIMCPECLQGSHTMLLCVLNT